MSFLPRPDADRERPPRCAAAGQRRHPSQAGAPRERWRRLGWSLLAVQLLIPGLPMPPPALALPEPSACDAALAAARRQQSDLLAAVPQLQVLLLGEIHTSPADHAWQLRTLEALAGRRPLSLALEMIPAPRQSQLDRYGAGQLREEAFLQQVGWQEVWGHDPDLYLPLLRWARRERVPLLAINAEPELVRRVRREGLSANPGPARGGIGLPAPASAAERQRLELAWRGHRLPGTTPRAGDSPAVPGMAPPPAQAGDEARDLERFIASQLLRDRAMAEAIAAARRREPARLVVVLIGQGHLEAQGGVPLQLGDLGLTQGILALRRPPLPPGCGPAPPGARLGAYLESPAGQVWVRRVAPGSAAAAAGLRPGDRILELNGTAVEHAGQVIRGVRLHPDGIPLQLTIERAGRRLKLRLTLPPRREPSLAARENGVPSGTWGRPPTTRPAPPLPLALSPP